MNGLIRICFRLLAFAAALATAACASHAPMIASNVSVGSATSVLPRPLQASNSAPPSIQAMHFSSLNVARGSRWSGEFITPTNVASLEVRTNLFSIDVPRSTYGRFAFTVNVLDTPPIFVRHYRLRVIARNTGGVTNETDLPFQIR